MIGKIEGLENPNPPPPPRTDGEEEEGEQAAVSPEYVFYQVTCTEQVQELMEPWCTRSILLLTSSRSPATPPSPCARRRSCGGRRMKERAE
eukprot:758654-Hanusia_phi.AAC.1